MELRRYWNVVRKRWWMVALITLVSCTAAGYYSSQMVRPQYAASAQLIVNQNKNLNSPIPDYGAISSNILITKTYIEIIRSPRIMGKVVQQFPELNTTVGELRSKVSAASVKDTQVISVSARDFSSEKAAKMANAVSRVFQQEIPTLMKLDNVSVLYWADPLERPNPVSPRPAVNILVAFVLASMAGTALVFLLNQLDDTIQSEKDIRTLLEIPALASIPKMKGKDLDGVGQLESTTNPAGRKASATFDS